MASTISAVNTTTSIAGPGDDACFVSVRGSTGQIGWYGPVNTAVGRYVDQTLACVVVGEAIPDHEKLHLALCQASADDTTATASWAVGAVDCALWDLHGQLAQTPVAELLVDVPEPAVPLYASWLGLAIPLPLTEGTVEPVGRNGWRFTKWGLRANLGGDIDVEADRLVAKIRAVTRALRAPAAFDAVFTWDSQLVHRVANQFDPADVLWLEDPLPDDDVEAYRPLGGRVPLALGERLLVHANEHAWLNMRPRALTLDVVGCGGLTRARRLVTAAAARGTPVYPHGRSFVPGVHLAAAYPEAIPAVEYRLQWEPIRQQQYARPWHPAAGMITIPRSPGLCATPRSH